MAVHLWPDVSNVNGRPISLGAAMLRQVATGARRQWRTTPLNVEAAQAMAAQGMEAIAAKASEGTGFVDSLLGLNHAAAVKAGLPFLAYHYPHTGSGAQQADLFISTVAKACGDVSKVALMVDREAADGPTTDAFITEVRRLAPKSPLCGYEAGWVVAQFGTSKLMGELPLVWSSYPGGLTTSQTVAQQLALAQARCAPFGAFGGHSRFTAWQFSDSGNVGGIAPCDVNAAFSDADFAALFPLATPQPTPAPAPTPAPTPTVGDADMMVHLFQEKDAKTGATLDAIFVHDSSGVHYVDSPQALADIANEQVNIFHNPHPAISVEPAGFRHRIGVFQGPDPLAGKQ